MNDEALLSEKSTVFIPVNLDKIEICKFSEANLVHFHGLEKYTNGTSNELAFETVTDFADPASDYAFFVYHNHVDKYKFEHYFCWINIDQIGYAHEKEELQVHKYLRNYKLEYY